MGVDAAQVGQISFTLTAEDLASRVLTQLSDNFTRLQTVARQTGSAVQGTAAAEEEVGSAASSALSAVGNLTINVGALRTASEEAAGGASMLGGALGSTIRRAGEFAMAFAEFRGIEDIFSGLKGAAIDFNAHLEQAQIAWTTFLGSASQATAMINNLQQFAATTPFRFQGLEDTARLLVAMGTPAQNVMGLLTDIGNAASATGQGAAGMQRIAYALGEMQSIGRVDARLMRELAFNGIPAWQMLADAMQLPIDKIREMSQKGEITSQQFLQAFESFSQTHWGDLMQKQSTTFLGALSTVQDNLQMAGANVFHPFFQVLSEDMANFAKLTMSQGFQEWVIEASQAVQSLVNAFSQVNPHALEAVAAFTAATLGARLLIPEVLAGASAVGQFVDNLLGVGRAILGVEGLQTVTTETKALSGAENLAALATEQATLTLGALSEAANVAAAAVERLTVAEGELALAQRVQATNGASSVLALPSGMALRPSGLAVPAAAAEEAAPALAGMATEEAAVGASAAAAESGVTGMSAAVVGLGGTLGVATLAIGAFAAAYATNFLGVRDITNQVTARIGQDLAATADLINRTGDALGNLATKAATALGPAGSAAGGVLQGVGSLLGGIHLDIGQQITSAIPMLGPTLETLHQVDDAVKAHQQSLIDVKDAADTVGLAERRAASIAVQGADAAAASAENAAAATADWSTAVDALAKSLGGESSVLTFAVSADPAMQAMNDQLDTMKTHLNALRDAQSQASAAGRSFKATMESSIPGLQAFDEATFGISQHLAAVQLQVEQQKLSRLEAHGASANPRREEVVLQEELKVRGLQRQVEFGGQLHDQQLAQQQVTSARSSETAAIKAQQDAITATQEAIKVYSDLIKEQDKVLAGITPKLNALTPYFAGLANLLSVSPEQMQEWIKAFGPAEAAKQAQLRNDALNIGINLPLQVAQVNASGGDITTIPGLATLPENTDSRGRHRIGGVQGFASGGSWTVGGTGGTDSQLVQFMATPNERVTVTPPGQNASGQGMQVHLFSNAAITIHDSVDIAAIGQAVVSELTALLQSRGHQTSANHQLAGARS